MVGFTDYLSTSSITVTCQKLKGKKDGKKEGKGGGGGREEEWHKSIYLYMTGKTSN